MKRIALLVSLVGTLAAAPLRAEFRQINITAFGMDCATCAHAMSVSIKKISGVQSVSVLLNRGLVDVKLKPRNTVKIEQIRKAIRDDAFTPKDARVVAVGALVSQGGKLQFKVSGTNETFPVVHTPHKSWQSQMGHTVTVNGLLSAGSGDSGTLQITSIAGPSATGK